MSYDTDIQSPKASNSTFLVVVILSVIAHIAVILIANPPKFVPKSWLSHIQLDVVLVNAHGERAPDRADALAQFNLNGGGNTDDKDHAKSPLPAQDVQNPSQDLSMVAKQVIEDEERQRKLLSTLKNTTALQNNLPQPTRSPLIAEHDVKSETKEAIDTRLEAEIAKERKEYEEKPRTAYVGIRTKGVVEAKYVDDWRARIEKVGTLNYPVDRHGKRMSGSMLVTVEVNADGSLGNVTIERSSGNKDLDAAAKEILKLSAPFPNLPKGIKDVYGVPANVLSITRYWTFGVTGNQLVGQL